MRGNPGQWFGPDSYPKEALRDGIQGRVVVVLEVDATGTPATCSVEVSVAPSLDRGTCDIALAHVRFTPATDETGNVALAEAEHPVQCCFIGLAGVTTLLIAQGAIPYSRPFAILLFGLGAGFTLAFALWRTGKLWRGQRDPGATTPVLYLPAVAGGFVTGTTAAALGWTEWGQMAFGAALFSWFAIESVLLHRLYTADTLPPPLRPTLGIQLAPPAVGAVSYLAIGGAPTDLFVHALIGYALLQALLLLRMARWIGEAPFAASYWAFTFGAVALATAVAKIAIVAPSGAMAALAPVLFIAANLLVLVIAIGTLVLLFRGRLLPARVAARVE